MTLSAERIVDLLTGLPTITGPTRLAVCAALDRALARGDARPTPHECEQGAREHGANVPAVSAAWGYLGDGAGEWIDTMQPTRRRGDAPNAESVVALLAFSLAFDVPLPSFTYTRSVPA